MNWHSYSTGFLASAALIMAIGAQNAFVLRLGLRGQNVLPVIVLCAVSDAILITLGVCGLGSVIAASPGLLAAARWGGAAFLVAYGVFAFQRALRPAGAALTADASSDVPVGRILVTALGFTFLNPHVYLDTIVLLGALGASQPAAGQVPFVLGSTTASLAWFLALGYGARGLAPVFANPLAWRVLDALVGALMLALALGLIVRG